MQSSERRNLLHLIERARAFNEVGYSPFFQQGVGFRFHHSLADARARGVAEVVAIALLRQNPGRLALH